MQEILIHAALICDGYFQKVNRTGIFLPWYGMVLEILYEVTIMKITQNSNNYDHFGQGN